MQLGFITHVSVGLVSWYTVSGAELGTLHSRSPINACQAFHSWFLAAVSAPGLLSGSWNSPQAHGVTHMCRIPSCADTACWSAWSTLITGQKSSCHTIAAPNASCLRACLPLMPFSLHRCFCALLILSAQHACMAGWEGSIAASVHHMVPAPQTCHTEHARCSHSIAALSS